MALLVKGVNEQTTAKCYLAKEKASKLVVSKEGVLLPAEPPLLGPLSGVIGLNGAFRFRFNPCLGDNHPGHELANECVEGVSMSVGVSEPVGNVYKPDEGVLTLSGTSLCPSFFGVSCAESVVHMCQKKYSDEQSRQFDWWLFVTRNRHSQILRVALSFLSATLQSNVSQHIFI